MYNDEDGDDEHDGDDDGDVDVDDGDDDENAEKTNWGDSSGLNTPILFRESV